MKLFQKIRWRKPTPIEQLAEYESKIAYYQSVIEHTTASLELFTNCISGRNCTNTELSNFFMQINDYNDTIGKATSNLEYYKVLRDNLKKELKNQNS